MCAERPCGRDERPWRGPARRAPSTGIIPALYLSMIAVDRSCQGERLGSDLAIHASNRARNVSSEAGIKLVVRDVIDDGGGQAYARRMEFCGRLEFQSFQGRPNRVFMTIGTIRATLGDG